MPGQDQWSGQGGYGGGGQSDQMGQQSDQYGQQGNEYGQQGDQYAQQPEQYGQQSNQYGQQADQYGQQGNQYGQQADQSVQQPEQYGQQQGMGMNQGQGSMLGGARQQAEGQVDNIIDQYAGQVPGGEQFKQQAKDMANQGLDEIEKQAEGRLGNLGGIFGNQGNQ